MIVSRSAIPAAAGTPAPPTWLTSTSDSLLEALDTRVTGLSPAAAAARLTRDGPNELPAAPGVHPLAILAAQVVGPMPAILAAAIGVALLAGEWVDAGAIAAIFVLNTVLGFVQEFRAERALEQLRALSTPTARVVRGGRLLTVAARELTVGDVIQLEAGDHVPADARIIEAYALQTQEAALTGESAAVDKRADALADERAPVAEWCNAALMGTAVTSGRGRAVVVRTGAATEIGRIAVAIRGGRREPTPLQVRLGQFARQLGVVVLAIAIVILLTGLWRGGRLVETLIAAVALAVAAIPEGLPAVVTIALAVGVRRMAARQVLVRKLASVETLGSTTVICTDKTGTLTRNVMSVRRVWAGGYALGVEAEPGPRAGAELPHDVAEDLAIAMVLCNNAEPAEGGGALGDPTEGALLDYAGRLGVEPGAARQRYPRVDEVPFSSERKCMSTVHARPEGGRLICCKGALDRLLPLCTHWQTERGAAYLDEPTRAALTAWAEAAADDALRVLAVAYREAPGGAADGADGANHADQAERGGAGRAADYERDLTLAGLVALMDPPRPGVAEALATCRAAGVRVLMITGDHARTAGAIGRELGLTGDALTGAQLERLDDAQMEDAVERVTLFARVDPAHKLRIVQALQRRGHVVAMTGDGVNDAPALQRANIGVAMGITGTEVAKEAADMVLLDDHFQSIVAAVEEGRGIYDNIRKFVLFLLSCNLSEVATIFLALLIGWPLPLVAVQILLMNLLTDGLPALALGVDRRAGDVMRRPPRRPHERLVQGVSLAWLLVTAAAMTASALAIYAWGLTVHGLETARTMAFVTLSLSQLAHAFNAKAAGAPLTLRLLGENRGLWAAVGSSLAIMVLVIHTPLAGVFQVAELSLRQWAACGGASLFVLPVSAGFHHWVRGRSPSAAG